MSQLLELNSKTLGLLDRGKLSAVLELALERAVVDCLNRPGDDRKRKVVLEIDLTPKAEIFGETISCETAKGHYRCAVKLPNWESNSLSFGVQKRGKNSAALVFNEDSPEDVHQQTFLDSAEES